MTSSAISLFVGTTKGAFMLDGDADRENWTVSGPFCEGCPISHVIGHVQTGMIWAGGGGDWDGAVVWRSYNHGAKWPPARLTTGQRDEWAANDPDIAKMICWINTGSVFASSDEVL